MSVVAAIQGDVVKDLSLALIAKEALIEADGDTKKARTLGIQRVLGDRRLNKEIVADAVCNAVELEIRRKVMDDRKAIISAASDPRAAVRALSGGIQAALLDFPLPSGRKLRDALPDEVSPVIERYEALGADVTRKARWLRLVIQGVPRDKKIGSVISDKRAQELFEEAANVAA